MSFSKFNKSSQ